MLSNPGQEASLASAEADHRIANHLSMLSAVIRHRLRELKSSDSPISAKELLTDLSCRVEALARLHRVLAESPKSKVSISRLVREVCTHTAAIFPTDQVSLSVHCAEDSQVSPNQAGDIGGVVAEMLTNSIKYSHPTGLPVVIHVTCSRVKEAVSIAIADDGVGLPENFDPQTSTGLGFTLMRATAKKLGGRVEFESTPVGLISRLLIPTAEKKDTDNVVAFRTP